MSANVQPALGSGAMFDGIAPRYDRLNRILSLGQDRRWRRRLVEALGPGDGPVLDLATGTADVALALHRAAPGRPVVGLDPSPGMLTIGRQKCANVPTIALVGGDAQALPFPADHFDAACISFGLRNVPDRQRCLREMTRVTRPGGVVAVLELGEPRGRILGPLARLWIHRMVPRIGAWISSDPEYAYLARSIAAFPPAEVVAGWMCDAGLREVTVRPLTLGAVNLYRGLR